ncbi:hypothetical protein BN136_1943 [Cronobacter universalis NCTC 9529]|nr:hypothetical protein BN136_1943 [Cronobacter universalis NCTC 9529]
MLTYFNHLFYSIIIKMIKNGQIKIMLKNSIFSARCLAPRGVR